MSLHIPTSLTLIDAVFVVVTSLLFLFLKQRRASKQPLPYPPGPRPLPLIGNVIDMPQSRFAVTWTKFGEEYGPLTWLTIPGQNFLVLNSFEAAEELFRKRALNFIDRPRLTMVKELMGMGGYLAFNGYNGTWRKQRGYLKHALSAAVVRTDYSSLMEVSAQKYLERCLTCPENSVMEISRIMKEIIVKLTYGRLQDERGTDYLKISSHVTKILALGIQGYVVDLLPTLRYLPGWLPGMKFKRDAARWKSEINELEHALFNSAQENALSKDPEVQSSFMFKKLQGLYDKYEDAEDALEQIDDELDLARSGLQFFLAGAETTQTTTESFVRAMLLFPSAQLKAQAEIDRVVGSGRLPGFKDQPNLPYLHAVVLETLRWHPVASFGLAHVSRADDTYDGYFIPKGTSVIANAWGFSRNSKYYSNPSVFDPERHLKQPPELDPREFVFGYGRRICPGKDLAFQQVWILVVSILWSFQLVRVDDDPTSLPEDTDLFSFEFISHPRPFQCRFVPRQEGLKDKLGVSTAESIH